MIIVGEIPSPSVDMEHKPREIPILAEKEEDSDFQEIFDKELGRNEDATTQIKSIFAGV